MELSTILFIFIAVITLTILLVSLITYFNSNGKSSPTATGDELILIAKPNLLSGEPSGMFLEGEGTIDWGDGTIEPFNSAVKSGTKALYIHQYANDNEYTIIIKGKILSFVSSGSSGGGFSSLICSTVNFKSVPNLNSFNVAMNSNIPSTIIGLEKTLISELIITDINIDILILPESGTINKLFLAGQNTVNITSIENLTLQTDLDYLWLGNLSSISLTPGLDLSSFNKLLTLTVDFDIINTSFTSLTIPNSVKDLTLRDVLTTENDTFTIDDDDYASFFNSLISLSVQNVYYFGATNLNLVSNNVLETLSLNVQDGIGPDGGCMTLNYGGSKSTIKDLSLSSFEVGTPGCQPVIGTGLTMNNLENLKCNNFDCSTVDFSTLNSLITLSLDNGIGGTTTLTLPSEGKITNIYLQNNASLSGVVNMGASLYRDGDKELGITVVNLLDNDSGMDYASIGNNIKAISNPEITNGTLIYTSFAESLILNSLRNAPYNWDITRQDPS